MRLNSIYLNFAGNTEEVFLFYKSIFKREFDSLVRFKDMPMPGVTLSEADRLFAALSAGGVVEMAMADMPWGDYFGSFKDKFGIGWMISLPNKK
ncbi:MAG: hypothetical protein JSR44_08790 [Spirochaetes bacterium]|nr:hypothetical protein [Spirochaetota bacterium]